MDSLSMLDKLQDATLEEYKKKQRSNKSKYHFDKLKMYFGEDYEVKGIKISTPTIGDILKVGEERFYQALSPFLYNSTSIRVMLWDYFEKDWNKVKDIEVYDLMSHMVQDKEPLKLIFRDKNFNDFQLVQISKQHEIRENDKKETREQLDLGLYSHSQDILLSEEDYMEIAEYIREMMNVHPKKEKVKGKSAIAWTIQEDKMNTQFEKDKNKSGSTLLPLISSCINHPGFKYKLQELREVGIYQFMDSVKRIQKYENGTAALKGCYSGFVSGKDISEDTLNFMGDV